MQRGYLINTLRVHTRNQPDDHLRIDRMPDGEDLFAEVRHALEALHHAPAVLDEKNSRAFDVTSVRVHGRAITVTADTGPYGARGNTTHVDTGDRRPFSERDANMTPKRALLWLPAGGEIGALFAERVGSSHLLNNLDRDVLKPLGINLGVSIKLASYVDVPAWEKYVDEAEGYSVKSIWRPTTVEQRVGGNSRDEGELRMQLSGGAAAEVIGNIRSYLREKFRGGEARGVELSVPGSLRPADGDDFARRRIEVSLDGPSGRRTLVIERDEPPAFIYPLADRVSTSALEQAWQQETVRLSDFYGRDVLPPWQS